MEDFKETDVATHLSSKTWAKILPYIKPHKGRVVFVLTVMLISALVDAVIPLFTRYAVDNFVVPRTTAGIGSFTAVYISVIVFQSIATVLHSRQSMIIDMGIMEALRRDCFVHLQRLPLSFYNTTSVGYIIARVISDTGIISDMLAWVGTIFFWHFFYILGMIVSMFLLDVKMALIVLSVVPFLVVTTLIIQPRMLSANRAVRKANSAITGSFNENVTGAKTSKTLVIEERNIAEFERITKTMYDNSLRSTRLNAVFLPVVLFFVSVSVAMALYFTGSDVISGAADLGLLSAFIAYAIAFLDPVSHVARFLSEVYSAQVNIERVMALLETPCDVKDSAQVEEQFGDIFNSKEENWPALHGGVEFDHVWFRYADAAEDDWVLEDISIKIPAGTTVAIVGETGAGKTTMVNLACRFFEPTKGRVLLDGVDYKERGLNWLHSNLGYVGQTPHLFSGSLMDNLRYGRPEATDAEIESAARLVSVDAIAEKLENGFFTDVGEGGERLSTGEKQLVALCRALVANPPIFVLDEATSSIDTETEAIIQNAISNTLTGRTSFIIAHRLSTIKNADLILLVEGRGIVERGSHNELMAKKGRYHSLYTAMMIKDKSKSEGFLSPYEDI